MTPVLGGLEPASPLLDEARRRWKGLPDLSFEVHPLLADAIGQALPILADGPGLGPRLRERLLAEAKRLQQLDVARDPAPPVAITLTRFGAVLVVSCLQMITRIRPTSDSLCVLAHVEGRRIQNLVCDTPELSALIDTAWHPPTSSRSL
ncbi:hypothetical protein ACFOY4_01055 [Actinomadura syzygii]|uniref:Uncharacterized protein n=1 Tax=Actinomadura syzygii TaxID=1427538 RepID=A0A5D0TTL2_9ACTN|nr:hypothetical protein [Actinomadura syzygii]TYC08655.1 hypothetical protein FXF65_37855 [Actinomadura syzygii]